ncbi:MAG TPA: hypothetical protein PKC39_05455 [Ferruginibacter sp.]|nr:hypothetical protein [Ferruginibacter sp.]HMP20387.1 hypothetical protein [Ferruginibacter sp.]
MKIVLQLVLLFCWANVVVRAQDTDSIAPDVTALPHLQQQKVNPFVKYTGKRIRSVRIEVLGFERELIDTTKLNRGIGVNVANALHRRTTIRTANNHLFFKEGETLNPYLLTDNERYLRDQPFFQDAIFFVKKAPDNPGEVDVLVLVKDVFSIGPGFGAGGAKKYRLELKEENLGGTGTRVAVSTLWDDNRAPKYGFGAELLRRNVKGSFINWSVGFQNYRNAFNSGRSEENFVYLKIEKPLVSQFIPWMGSLDISYNRTGNYYIPDSLYRNEYRYSFFSTDGWLAYNFGAKRLMYMNAKSTVRKFVAVRGFSQHFFKIPEKYINNFEATYSDVSGMLASFSMFKQNFYRANYIYGFGRNEDVPLGFSASVIGGYILKEDSLRNKLRNRPYIGLDGQYSAYGKNGLYSALTFRLGGYRAEGKMEDVSLLLNAEHFTKLKLLRARWYRRFFLSGGFSKQFSPVLDQSLFLRSNYGLPYFEYGYSGADLRATLKTEVVFYHTRRFGGFRFAPFAFGDMIMLKPTKQPLAQADLFSAVGAGLRTRNENLIFGTMEMRLYYFPRVIENMNHFKIKFNTNLRFRYNSSFIRKPDFVAPN